MEDSKFRNNFFIGYVNGIFGNIFDNKDFEIFVANLKFNKKL